MKQKVLWTLVLISCLCTFVEWVRVSNLQSTVGHLQVQLTEAQIAAKARPTEHKY
jgi:hypothetical protein